MLLAWNTELEAKTIVSFLFMRLCLNSTLRSEMSEADFSMCLFYIRLGTRFCLGTVTQGWTIFYLVKRGEILCQQNCSKNQNSACDQSLKSIAHQGGNYVWCPTELTLKCWHASNSDFDAGTKIKTYILFDNLVRLN